LKWLALADLIKDIKVASNLWMLENGIVFDEKYML
jgi:hypothetical protein